MAEHRFYHQIAANRRNSLLLAAFVVVLLGLLGFAIGFAMTGEPPAASSSTWIALVVGSLAGIGTYFAGDTLVLAVSGAREVDEAAGAAAAERRPRDGDRGQHADAARLPHRRHGAERLRDGRDPKHASVAVTTGLLEKLDREELQGVIATSSRTSGTSTSGSR